MRTRRLLAASAALLVAAGLTAVPAASAQSAPVAVRDGSTLETAVFPNDRFTVADAAQLTGRRVNLPVPSCTPATRSACDAVAILNTTDGFDLQPRVFLPFTGDVDVATVTPESVYVEGPRGRVGLQELTFDPASDVLAGTTRAQLPEQARHVLVITRLVRGKDGQPLAREVRVPFTTMSGTTELARLRAALDDGSAYAAAGIGSRTASFVQPNPGDQFSPIASGSVTTVFPPPPVTTENIQRNDQRTTSTTTLTTSMVPNLALAGVGCYAFGSYETPLFAREDSTITPTPTTQTPPVVGKARTGFALIVPAGTPPAGGWPVAVYGPGFTRSYFDLFVTADANALAGIATIATNPLGHGFGPASTITIQGPGTRFLSYGRGKDLTGDGTIEAAEGSQPAIAVSNDAGTGTVVETPSPNQVHGLRGGLLQTVVDNMALVRSVESGMDVPSCPAGDLPGPGNASAPDSRAPLSRDVTRYYGLSFGGIYGTMLMGTDPSVTRGLLNVGGGPITDIARLSGFRNLVGNILRANRPSLLNGGPGLNGFTESWPLPHDAPITGPVPGAMDIQRSFAYSLWYGRPGGPETYAPLLKPAGKDVLYQVAFGDNTVPNLTSGNIIRAGDLRDRTTYYRNDRTPTSGTNPHGFLADPTVFGRQMGQVQQTAFLLNGQVLDPDGPAPVFEVPIVNPDNLQCLHYPHPQTGVGAFGRNGGPAAAGECPARPADAQLQAADGGSGGTGGGSGPAPARGALPRTGAPVLLPLLGLAALGLGLAVRRRG
jgi:hypothetical protein